MPRRIVVPLAICALAGSLLAPAYCARTQNALTRALKRREPPSDDEVRDRVRKAFRPGEGGFRFETQEVSWDQMKQNVDVVLALAFGYPDSNQMMKEHQEFVAKLPSKLRKKRQPLNKVVVTAIFDVALREILGGKIWPGLTFPLIEEAMEEKAMLLPHLFANEPLPKAVLWDVVTAIATAESASSLPVVGGAAMNLYDRGEAPMGMLNDGVVDLTSLIEKASNLAKSAMLWGMPPLPPNDINGDLWLALDMCNSILERLADYTGDDASLRDATLPALPKYFFHTTRAAKIVWHQMQQWWEEEAQKMRSLRSILDWPFERVAIAMGIRSRTDGMVTNKVGGNRPAAQKYNVVGDFRVDMEVEALLPVPPLPALPKNTFKTLDMDELRNAGSFVQQKATEDASIGAGLEVAWTRAIVKAVHPDGALDISCPDLNEGATTCVSPFLPDGQQAFRALEEDEDPLPPDPPTVA